MFHVPTIFNSIGLLILRLSFGGMLALGHGLPKLLKMSEMKDSFADPLGYIAAPYAFYCLLGAEFLCAILVGVGLLTRLSALPIVYAMGVAAFVAHSQHPVFLGPDSPVSKEPALLYMAAFLTLVLTGPGVFSMDHFMFGRRSATP